MKSDEKLLAGIKREEGYTYRGANPAIPGRITELESLGYEMVTPTGEPFKGENKADEIAATKEAGGLIMMRVKNEDLVKRGRADQTAVTADLNAASIDARMKQDDRIKDRGDADLTPEERAVHALEIESKQAQDRLEAANKALEEGGTVGIRGGSTVSADNAGSPEAGRRGTKDESPSGVVVNPAPAAAKKEVKNA